MTRRPPRLPEHPSFGDAQSCPGKIPFFNKRIAKQRARELRTDGNGMHAYRCSACGYWHLGHAAGKATNWRHTDRLYQAPPREERA